MSKFDKSRTDVNYILKEITIVERSYRRFNEDVVFAP